MPSCLVLPGRSVILLPPFCAPRSRPWNHRSGFTNVELFRKYLWFLLRERQYDEEALDDLVALKAALSLSDEEVRQLATVAVAFSLRCAVGRAPWAVNLLTSRLADAGCGSEAWCGWVLLLKASRLAPACLPRPWVEPVRGLRLPLLGPGPSLAFQAPTRSTSPPPPPPPCRWPRRWQSVRSACTRSTAPSW